MQRFKRILVYMDTDRNNSAMLQRAVQLAEQNGTRLTVVSGCSRPPPNIRALVPLGTLPLSVTAMRKAKSDLLAATVAPYKATAPKLRIKLLDGTDFVSVVRCVLKDQHDLLMLAVDKPHFLRDRLFGSMTLHLLRKCPCPVWVFTPSAKKSFRRILAAVDASAVSEAEISMNRKILELATSLASRDNAELHVLHCWSSCGEAFLRARSDKNAQEITRYVQDCKKQQASMFRKVAHPFLDQTASMALHSRKGDPSILVPAFVTKHHIDLLVMGTVARTGIQGFLIGNTAEQILQSVTCSVLAVKPDGFVSPVQLM